MNKLGYEIIMIILNNFHKATRKIVQPRRKDHSSFAINDEYGCAGCIIRYAEKHFSHS